MFIKLCRAGLLIVFVGAATSCTGTLNPHGLASINAQLPVKRVILYQNGVGYFEREGKLKGNVLTLHCRPGQINDLLKSLTVIDRSSGRPLSVSLPLEKSGDKVLSELPKQVRGASGLLDVLRVFRGARVRVHGKRGTAEGRVLGVEQGLSPAKDKESPAWSVTLKDPAGDLRVFPVGDITRVELLDKTLEQGLDKSLDVSLQEGSWKSIALSVRLSGDSEHDLLVSYIVEMPMWKPAYRLVVHKERKPLLQGWAVVDNVSGESWNDVKLSLVTGTPMSFVYDLHTPRFVRRPDLSPRTTTAMAPPTGDVGRARPDSTKDMLQRSYSRRRSASGPRPSKTPAPASEPSTSEHSEIERLRDQVGLDVSTMNMALEQQYKQVKNEVKGQKVGSLFRYDLENGITVPDSSSTLVNIINARVAGAEVVLFRPELTTGQQASHPYRAVKFINESGFALEQGPVAIYSQGTFVGEGFLDRMEKGTTIFLTYSIDGNVTMSRSEGSSQEAVRLLKIRGGVVESEVLQVQRAIYTITNNHGDLITAYVKSTPPSKAYRLRRPPANTVETAGASYLPLQLPPGATKKLAIEWVSPVRRRLAIDSSLATTVLKMYIGTGQVPASIKPTLDKILRTKSNLDDLEREMSRIEKLKRTLSDDQQRVRSNLDLLRKVKGNAALKSRLTRSLATLEGKLGKLTARYVQLDEQRARLQGEMRILIGQISLDAESTK